MSQTKRTLSTAAAAVAGLLLMTSVLACSRTADGPASSGITDSSHQGGAYATDSSTSIGTVSAPAAAPAGQPVQSTETGVSETTKTDASGATGTAGAVTGVTAGTTTT